MGGPRTRRGIAAAALCAILPLLAACGSQNGLTGSLSDVFPLAFNSVDILENSGAFQVTYNFSQAGTTAVVAQMTVELEGLSLVPGATIDLSGNTPDGALRTAVTHLSAQDVPTVLPQVRSGTLTLSQGGGEVGVLTAGSFSLSFVSDGSAASGSTLTGSFSGPLQSAAFPPDGGGVADGG